MSVMRDFYRKCRELAAQGAVMYRANDNCIYLYDGKYGDWLDYIVMAHVVGEFDLDKVSERMQADVMRYSIIIEGISGASDSRSIQVRRILKRIFSQTTAKLRRQRGISSRDSLPGLRFFRD